MKPFSVFLFSGLLLGLLSPASIFAETIRGEILEVNRNNEYLRIRPAGESSIQPEMRILLNEQTQYQGAVSLSDLNVGDQVEVEIDLDDAGVWQTESIQPLAGERTASAGRDAGRESYLSGQEGKYEMETARETLLDAPPTGERINIEGERKEPVVESQEGKYNLETARNTSLEESGAQQQAVEAGGEGEDSITEQQEGKYGLETARNTSLEGQGAVSE